MRKTTALLCLAACLLPRLHAQYEKDRIYQVTQAFLANDQGQVLNRQTAAGRVVLSAGGSYEASLHIKDEGTWKLVEATPQQPRDTIVFTSKKGFQFYGYPQGHMMTIWLSRSADGLGQWLTAQLVDSKTAPVAPNVLSGSQARPFQGGLIRGNVFTAVVLYGSTSAPSYYWYDSATGGFSHDQKGIIFHPNGSYVLKADFGGRTMEERGRYSVQGDFVRIVFSDGSGMTLKIAEGGRKLHRNDSSTGMLLSEFFFLGTAR